jgi:hypothetical protein
MSAQSALAHSCIVSYNLKSAKFEHLFASQRDLTQSLQQKMEEAWVGRGRDMYPFPLGEAKNMIRHLGLRLVDYILAVQTEIVLSSTEKGRESPADLPAAVRSVTPPPDPVVRGMARGTIDRTGTGPTYFGEVLGSNLTIFDD